MGNQRCNVTVIVQSSSRREEFRSALVCVGPHDQSDICDLALCDRDRGRLRNEFAVDVRLELEAIYGAEELLVRNGAKAGQRIRGGIAANRCRDVVIPALVSHVQCLDSVHCYEQSATRQLDLRYKY